MKAFYRRSQAAMEFLMTYGWAFLIVLIVIFSLVYFGILDPGRFLPEKAELAEGVDIVDVAVDENSISFILRNTMGKDLLDFQINATECNDGNGTLSTPVDIPEGKTKKVTIYCEHDYAVGSKIDSGLEALWKTRTSTKGERYDFDQKTRGDMKVTVNEGKELFDRVRTVACGTLNLTRTTYILQNNLTTTGTCFDVTADSVTIDLNGYNISGDSNSKDDYGVDISGGYNSINVSNGLIYGFGRGVYTTGNQGTFSNLTIMAQGDFGMSSTIYGIYLYQANQTYISDIDVLYLNNTALMGLTKGISSEMNSYNEFNSINVINSSSSRDYGIYLGTSFNNTFNNIVLSSNYFAFYFYRSSNNSLNIINVSSNENHGLTFYSSTNSTVRNLISNSNEKGIWFEYNSFNNLIIDSNISDNRVYDFVLSDVVNNITFLNTTYDSSNISIGSGCDLTRKWYYKAYVNDSSGDAVSGAYVTGYNVSGDLIFNVTSGSDGWTPNAEIIEYVNNSGTTSYYSNYSVLAENGSWYGYRTKGAYNVSGNMFNDNITLSSYEWYYQEEEDEVSSAGGVWLNSTSIVHDGEWLENYTTVIWSGDQQGWVYVNYTKPENALESSLWLVRDSGATLNLSIPYSCWHYDDSKLILRVEALAPGLPLIVIGWHCYDGSWQVIREYPNSYTRIYEQAAQETAE